MPIKTSKDKTNNGIRSIGGKRADRNHPKDSTPVEIKEVPIEQIQVRKDIEELDVRPTAREVYIQDRKKQKKGVEFNG